MKIGEGISLLQTEAAAQGRSINDISLPEESEARENEVDNLLVDRLARFLGSHTLQFKVPKDAIEDMQRSMEEGMCAATRNKYFLRLFNLLLCNHQSQG